MLTSRKIKIKDILEWIVIRIKLKNEAKIKFYFAFQNLFHCNLENDFLYVIYNTFRSICQCFVILGYKINWFIKKKINERNVMDL